MRIFIRLAAVVCCSLLIVWLSAAALADLVADSPVKAPEKGALRPNILWISCEDTSPWLGFCGEKYARTPNLDRLAARGVSLHQRLRDRAGLLAVAVRDHHRLLRHRLWHAAAALALRRARGDPRLSGLSARGGLLLHEQLEDRLQHGGGETHHRRVVGRVQRQGPLAQPQAGSALLRRLQPDGNAPEPGFRDHAAQARSVRAARSGQCAAAALLPRHADGPPHDGPRPRLHHGDGQAGRRHPGRTGAARD